MSLKGQAVKGVMWNAIERFSTQGIQFILTIIIARLLSPDDYGLIAMLGIFMAIAQTFIDSGFGNALIQKQDRTEADYSTAFYFNIIVAVAFYLLFFFLAPWIASFYEQPELVTISRVYFIALIINSFATVQVARFSILLDFKKMAQASLCAVVLGGGVGIYMAYNGTGAWAIVGQSLTTSLLWTVVLWFLSAWQPQRRFLKSSFRSLFCFGSKLLFSNLLHTLYNNIYSLIIGKYFGAVELGYFNRSYTLSQFPVQNFGNIVQKVLYPVQCRYQNDGEKFNQIFILYLRLSSYILFPIMVALSALAYPVIQLILTDKWLPAAPLLQIISISMMWFPIMQANVLVLDAKGRSDYHLYSEIVKKILAVIILLVSMRLGIYGVCWGLLVYSFVDMAVVIAFSRRLTGIGYRGHFFILAPVTLVSLIMWGGIWLLTSDITVPSLSILVGICTGTILFVSMSYVFRLKSMRVLVSFAKGKGDWTEFKDKM
ncbi:MAG: lipopolysaccharide biosynthesis protein [Bacteroides sp.]|nr:lipopolysaccharide biosynthesis protein [Bacteroides sp.]